MSDDPTLTEKARVNLPVTVVWSCAVILGTIIAFGVGTYVGFKNDVVSIREDLAAMGVNIEKIANRVESGPSRREFELLLERLRYLEQKIKE